LKKILVLCINYEKSIFPNQPDAENRFYVYGFGAEVGKNLKTYIPEYEVEVWRLDSNVKHSYEKKILDVIYKIFPSFQIKGFSDFSVNFIRALRKEARKSNPILFVIFNHYGVLYQAALFFSKLSIITTHHGGGPPAFDFKHDKKIIHKIRAGIKWLIEKLTYRNVNVVLVGETKESDYLKKNFPDIKCVSWSWGINLERFYPNPVSRTNARNSLGWDNNKKYILYVGKLYKYKEVDKLIEIWKEIKKERPEVELVLAGNEPKGHWGEEYYEMAVGSGAMVLGRILNVDLHKYYTAADVYVMIALREDYYGGTGIAPLESLACNTPVVSYALRNYIGDSVNEIGEMPDTLDGYKKAILNVLDHPEQYKNMRESIEKFYSSSNTFKNLKPYLEELFNKRRK